MFEHTQHLRTQSALDNVSAAWLVRGRWWAYPATAAITAAAAHEMRLVLPFGLLAGLLTLALFSNVVAQRALERRWVLPRPLIALTLVCDSLMATALVFGTGSQSSPVVLLLLLPPVVSATCLGWRATWVLVALALCGLLAVGNLETPLFFDHHHDVSPSAAHTKQPHTPTSHAALTKIAPTEVAPSAEPTGHTHETANVASSPQTHLWSHVRGAWLSLALFALLIVYMLRSAVVRHQSELMWAQTEVDHHKQVAEVASVAANIAHALGSPLSTVVMLAEDLARDLDEQAANPRWQRDLQAINEQLARCQKLLRSGGAGNLGSREEPQTTVSLSSLVDEARQQTEHPGLVLVRLSEVDGARLNWLDARSVVQLVTVLLENALQSAPGANVVVEANTSPELWELRVIDRGPGLPAHVLERLGKKPVTTKSDGLGIGLFLGNALLERLGGELHFAAADGGQGTVAVLKLPVFTSGSKDRPPAREQQSKEELLRFLEVRT